MSATMHFFKEGQCKIKSVPDREAQQEFTCIMYTTYFTGIKACQALFMHSLKNLSSQDYKVKEYEHFNNYYREGGRERERKTGMT